MNKRLAISLTSLLLSAAASNATVYDLKNDWSDTSNPNGVWTYLVGGTVGIAGVRGSDVFAFPPGAPVIWTRPGAPNWEGWSLSNGSQSSYLDILAGDVYGHVNASMAILWTSPGAGTIDVEGAVWHVREIGRHNGWEFLINDSLVDSGIVSTGDEWDRTSPRNFGANGVSVNSGDTVRFNVVGLNPDYIAVDLTIELLPRGNGGGGDQVPDGGGALALLLAGLTALGTLARGRGANLTR